MKIAIVLPTSDMVHTDFLMCLTILASRMSARSIMPVIINPRSSLVQKGRWEGVFTALRYDIDKILFIDSDQTFPPDAFSRLFNHNKKIVGATYRLRQDQVEYTARNKKGDRIDFSYRKGLHKVTSNGLGFTLIDAEVFHKLEQPWFNVTFDDDKWTSEDESFCHTAASAGYNIWVDADLTKEIGHIGTWVYI